MLKGECDRFSRSESGGLSAGVQPLVESQGEPNPLKKMKVSYMIGHQHFNLFLVYRAGPAILTRWISGSGWLFPTT